MVDIVSCFTILTLILDFGALMNTWYNGKYDRWREGIEVRYLAPGRVMSVKKLPMHDISTYLHSPTLHPQVSPQLQLLEPQFWLTGTATVWPNNKVSDC